MEKINERKSYIDILKGIGIFYVVFGHITHVWHLREYIGNFHIPLFFWVSGLLFNDKKFPHFVDILKSRLKSIYIPYVLFFLVTFAYWALIERHVRGGEYSFFHQLLGLLYGTYEGFHLNFNGALWFLPCLFAVELMFYFIARMKDIAGIVAMLLLSFVIGTLILQFKFNILPFGIHTAFFGIVFYGLGFLSKPFVEKVVQASLLHKLLLLLGCFAIQLSGMQVYSSWMQVTTLPYIPLALAGIFFYLLISKLIGHNRIFQYLGINSLVILAFQEPLYRAVIFIFSKLLAVDGEALRGDVLFGFAISVVTILLILPVIYLYNKFVRVRINTLFS